MSKIHKLKPFSDFQKLKDVSVSQRCAEHEKVFDIYCSIHDKHLCIDCVDQHNACPQLMLLDKVALNAKQSTALSDLEESINVALQNVSICIKDQTINAEKIDTQESLIKKSILFTREKLNKLLDRLDQNLLKDLSDKTLQCKSEYCKTLEQLKLADQKLSEIKQEVETMKQIATDVQVFLGTRVLNTTVYEEIKTIKNIIANTKYFEIDLEIASLVTSFTEFDNQLAVVSLQENKSELKFKDAKLDQAQNLVFIPPHSGNQILDLQLKKDFRFPETIYDTDVFGCLILPKGHILIANRVRKGRVMELNEQGRYVQSFYCYGVPYYLTLIDSDRIAMTFITDEKVAILDLNNGKLCTITLTNLGRGISYQDDKLYVLVANKGIEVIWLSGEILYTIAIDTKHVYEIVTFNDRIYYINELMQTVHCLSLTGEEIWTYQDQYIFRQRGVTAANDEGLFVVRNDSLYIIKQNGLTRRIQLQKSSVLEPSAVYYNNERKELLVCDTDDTSVAVYNVIVG